jgi:hypothetical protein
MKPSIATTLIVIAAVFCFVSGYSIGAHSDQATAYRMANQSNTGTSTANAAEKAVSPSGGYGAPASEETGDSGAESPGYGAPSPGYGQ